MGEFAADVQEALRESLAARTDREWTTERYVRRTPVDVATVGPPDVLVELEWRRADPVNNPVKLARYASEGAVDGPVVLIQVFSAYYDLAAGGVSSKRANAEFAGRLAADALDGFAYHALDLPVAPPKRGGDRPDGWRTAVQRVAGAIAPHASAE